MRNGALIAPAHREADFALMAPAGAGIVLMAATKYGSWTKLSCQRRRRRRFAESLCPAMADGAAGRVTGQCLAWRASCLFMATRRARQAAASRGVRIIK